MHPLNITNSKIPETFKYPQQSLASILLTETNTYEHRGSKTWRFFSDYHSIHEHSPGIIFYNLFIHISFSNFKFYTAHVVVRDFNW